MQKEISTTHLATLEQLLFKPWEQGNNQLMTQLEEFCRFYDDGDMNHVEVQNMNALSEIMEDFHALKVLLKEMEELLANDFFQGFSYRQDAENEDAGQEQKPDYESTLDLQPMIYKLEEIRKRLNLRKISTSILIRYIARKARDRGHIIY